MQRNLFGDTELPEGFAYRPDAISPAQERVLISQFESLTLRPFEFHGFLGKRRIVSFGFSYDYTARKVRQSHPFPPFLLELREMAAVFAQTPAEQFAQAMVTEYTPGAGIGWHRDKREFQDVVAFSFAAACTLRFRQKKGAAWERRSKVLESRSLYLLRGPARWEWEHSISGVSALRYSVTFRNFVEP